MGFFNDFIRGATPAIAGGTDIGLRGMAEAQRRKEEAEIQRRNAEQQAFMNLMRQQQFEAEQQQAAQGQQNWQRQFDEQHFLNQQHGVDELSNQMLRFKENLADNALAKDKYQNIELPESKAKIANYQEPNNRYAAGFDGSQEQKGFSPEEAMKYARLDAQNMAQTVDEYGDPTGQVDPVKFDQIVKQRYQFYATFNPNQQQPTPDGGNSQRAPMGAQGQPVPIVGGQPQPQMDRATMLRQKFDANPSSLTPEEFDELGMYLNGGK